MSRTPSIAPLATIYEESSSFAASTTSSQYKCVDDTLSARSISIIDTQQQQQQQRAHDNYQKPPIEVQFRDGSRRYIPPLKSVSMKKDKHLFNSPYDTSSIKTNSTRRSIQTKPPLVVTIITAEDLQQAGISSNISSSSDTSNLSSRTSSPMESVHKKLTSIESTKQNATPVFSIPSSEQLFSITNQELPNSSFQVTLTNDENEKSSTLNSILTNKTVNQTVPPNTTILVQGKIRSAFRPFLKSVRFNQDTFSNKQRLPTTSNIPKPVNPPQQLISNTNGSYQLPPKRVNTIQPKHPSLNINSLVSMNPTIYQQQQQPLPIQAIQSFTLPHLVNSGQTVSFAINPNLQWHNVISNSIYEIPRISTKYSRIPLRITLPVVNSTHNQRFLKKHDTALEERLLHAGLSPETIALYERILDVADTRKMMTTKFPSSKIINQYPYKTFL